jgi:hypothetical protein
MAYASPLGTNSVIKATVTWLAPNLYEVSNSHITTYYSTHDASSSSLPLHLPPQSSLHVISDLTCNTFTLAQRQMQTHLPICNWFEKQWLPPMPPKINNSDNGITPTYDSMDDQAQPTSYMTTSTLWLSLNLLLCSILLAKLFTSWLRMKQNSKWTIAT